MATPALRLLRSSYKGIFIGALCRPGIDDLFRGSDLFDELHPERDRGVFGPKFTASKIRPRMYDAALLLTNSFSTALTTRIAGIPRRIGYNRDGRGFLLTDKLIAPTRSDGSWAIIPACQYYYNAANYLITGQQTTYSSFSPLPIPLSLPPTSRLELPITPEEHAHASRIFAQGHQELNQPFALINPGGNNPIKRWPADRFALLIQHLANSHGLRSIINGSPNEADLVATIARACDTLPPALRPLELPSMGITIGALKAIINVASIVITNDTGPRHLAAACARPLISLFGPTDHRWTLLPTNPAAPEMILCADPTLPQEQSANDHPQRCAIEHITSQSVHDAVDSHVENAK